MTTPDWTLESYNALSDDELLSRLQNRNTDSDFIKYLMENRGTKDADDAGVDLLNGVWLDV